LKFSSIGTARADERLVLRREQVRARAQDLGRAAAEDDVLGIDPLFLGDRFDQPALAAVVAPRPGARRTERVPDRFEDRLARPARVFIARQADDSRLDGFERRLEGGPDAVLAAARADVRGHPDAGGLDE
jgi:hypothetical protein